MDVNPRVMDETRATVSHFFSSVMVPLARLLMRFGFSARQANDVTRWSFVRCFWKSPDLWNSPRPSFLQGAIKTGLHRVTVKDLVAVPEPDNAIFAHRQNLAYRVLEGWINDPEFHDEHGSPAQLPVRGPGLSFSELVRRYGNDVRDAAVLRDLESAGCVERRGAKVEMVNQTYGLHFLDEEKLQIVAHMVRHLLLTSEYNLVKEDVEERRLQRFWSQTRIPRDREVEAKKIVTDIAVAAGRQIDNALAKFRNSDNSDDCVEIGVAMYLYREENEDQRSEP